MARRGFQTAFLVGFSPGKRKGQSGGNLFADSRRGPFQMIADGGGRDGRLGFNYDHVGSIGFGGDAVPPLSFEKELPLVRHQDRGLGGCGQDLFHRLSLSRVIRHTGIAGPGHRF
jgi:hypothetical protein